MPIFRAMLCNASCKANLTCLSYWMSTELSTESVENLGRMAHGHHGNSLLLDSERIHQEPVAKRDRLVRQHLAKDYI
jgi:hypothetical protein